MAKSSGSKSRMPPRGSCSHCIIHSKSGKRYGAEKQLQFASHKTSNQECTAGERVHDYIRAPAVQPFLPSLGHCPRVFRVKIGYRVDLQRSSS